MKNLAHFFELPHLDDYSIIFLAFIAYVKRQFPDLKDTIGSFWRGDPKD